MESVAATQYWLTRFCIQKTLAAVYLVAFLVVVFQINPLVGQNGLLPARYYLQQVKFWDAPGLFWIHLSDRGFLAAGWLGVILSLTALSGFSERYGLFFSGLIWGLLWVLYMSFVNVGQVFWSFGWESLLLETGFLAIFLGSADKAPAAVVIWLFRWVLFRVIFGAGLIKLRGDPCWRDLTCMFYHYETQPLPNPLSWYFHKLPAWMHRTSVLFTHFVEIIVPWGYFGPRRVAYAAGLFSVFFQVMLILSGNLSWLNYLTIVLCLACFDDAFLSRFLPIRPPETLSPVTGVHQGVLIGLACLIALMSVRPVLNLVSSRQIMNTSFDPLRLVNTYGAFGSVSRRRTEIVLEGTSDRYPAEFSDWKEYEFKGKPGRLDRAPCVVSPYHYRLDWQMWFAAMSDYRYHPWIVHLVAKLLRQDRGTLSLLGRNPFPENPPRYIRAVLYEYRFTTSRENRAWWERTYLRQYLPPLSLEDPALREFLRRLRWS